MNRIALILVGIISGFFIGLLGIGSGIITIPGLTLAGMTLQQSITTGLMLQAVPQTIPAFLMYEKKGHFKWEYSMYVLLGSLIGIFIGAVVQNNFILNDQYLYTLLSIILVISGIYTYYRNVWNPLLEKTVKVSEKPSTD